MATMLASVVFLAGCTELQFLSNASKELGEPKQEVARTVDTEGGNGARYKVGKPYQIKGKWYYPREDFSYVEQGVASWYGPKFHGRKTANGAIFDMNKVSAAHRTLPLPSIVRVTNLENGRSLKVKVNDRGPYAHGRIIDMSRRAAQLLGFETAGTALVRVEILEGESRQLVARMTNQKLFKDQPPPPDAAPSIAVTSEELAPPPGATVAPAPSKAHEVQVAELPKESEISRQSALPDATPDETVTVVPVAGAPEIYIQAGAFAQYGNAVRSQALLSTVGQTKIQQINQANRPLFRVRVGPIKNVEDADKILQDISRAGFPDARIVVSDKKP